MKYLSICSGIEAATTAWHALGWQPLAFSEIEPFPSAVLAHHWPDVPNLGDMTHYGNWPSIRPDLIVGGTPCQAFSVAGLRKGLADPRGNLTLTFLAILARYRPAWVVWENVPGVLSDRTGAFGAFLSGLSELGYGWSYRVLDAQYFGVPQRRRRVFVVGHFGDWRRAAAVLFERESLLGHSPPSRDKGSSVAALTANGVGTCGADDNQGQAGHLIRWPAQVAPTLNASFGEKQGLEDQHINGGAGCFVPVFASSGQANAAFARDVALALNATHEQGYIAHTLRAESYDASEDGTGRGTPLVPVAFAIQDGALRENVNSGPQGKGYQEGVAYTLEARDGMTKQQCVAFATTQITSPSNYSNPKPGDACHPLAAGAHAPALAYSTAVRRLTPRECERLQGFPDDHTLIPWRKKPADECPDGPRYKALGNSMAVPVMRWIGERINLITAISK